ncbi:hypothetical protein LSM04_008659 [Trypanosoma melophagium]|uniref:uncharacterized protein n=1 Tax=Trypanosoma melophagium TaxID=715481 RepID=UPI003519DC1F|nr:hypothetical protein LSM04_008659 [Trypanosoma melophagium]
MLLHWLREITYCSHIVKKKKENEKREESVKVFFLDSEDCAVDKVALLRRWAKDSSNQTILLLSHTTFTHLMMSPSMTSKPSARYSSSSSTCSDNNTAVSPPVRKNGGAGEKVTSEEEEEKEGVRGRRKKKQKIEIEEEMYWIDGPEKEGDEMQKKSNQVDGIEKGKEKDLVLGDSEIYAEGREILLTHCTLFVLDEAHKIIDDHSLLLDALRKLSPHILRLALTNITRLDISRPCVTQELMAILQFILPTLWENEKLNSPAQLPQYFKSFFHLCNMDTLIQEGIFFCETSIVTYLSPHQSNMLRDLVMLMQEHGTIPVKDRLTFASRFWMISSYGDMLANHSNCSESHNITTAITIKEQNIAGGQEEMVSYLLPTLLLPYPLKNREEMEQLLENSWKMKGLFMLLNEALKRQEKAVVFSHSLKTLTLVAVLLKYLRNFVNEVDFATISGVLPLSKKTVYVNRLVSSHPLEVASMHLEGSRNSVGNTVVWRASCMLDTTTNILEKYNKNNSDDPVIMFMRGTCPDIIAATI